MESASFVCESQNHLLRNSNNYVKDKEIKAMIAKQ
jgi:hypothetical protein